MCRELQVKETSSSIVCYVYLFVVNLSLAIKTNAMTVIAAAMTRKMSAPTVPTIATTELLEAVGVVS